jgi:hypothetical protein
MVIISHEVLNVLNRIFVVGIAYNRQIPTLYAKARTSILNLDKTVANVFASSVNNAPYAWKRENLLVLVVGKYMFSYSKFDDGNLVVVHEVAENKRIVTEEKQMNNIIKETINTYLRNKLLLAS